MITRSRAMTLMAVGNSFLVAFTVRAFAQSAAGGSQAAPWARAAIAHAQRMREFSDEHHKGQHTPPVIPELMIDRDPTGAIASFRPGAETITSKNPFFQDLGTNGRTCFTCHQPQNGWTISAQAAHDRFLQSEGSDPLFRLVDGATCPSDDVSTPAAREEAYQLLINKGLIRVGLEIPANAQYAVVDVNDPYGCTSNPDTGLTSPTSGIVSVYRRPLPTANLGFLSTIMWDGREPSLEHQVLDATLIHAQANAPGPGAAQQAQIVDFQSAIFTA
jgi:cytochrome c peroxidase